jgi:hypothetical protein
MTKEELIKTTLEEIAKEKGLQRVEVTSYDLANRLAEKIVNKTNDIQNVSYSIATEYAVFALECARNSMPVLNIDDYVKQYCS